ncbi:helix-hairpin-helix domain-containing protein [Nocardioides sp. SYSU D00065]|uniref:helix-hairpin-helix domain-containing protein n=1 Tax=Nocardioides sp. SYSU D00065 TaxID=2817378 RepID=UPI001B31D9A5|nr:helix-hairpin-helix domain-containing protein [Nocardioides sp. SYSU D00065]
MMIRPAELAAIKAGTVDLAFRRWAKPRVVVGTRMRTAVGVVEVTSIEQVSVASLRAEDARRAGAPSLAALKQALAARSSEPAWRIGLTYAGPDPREALRESIPDAEEICEISARLDRLDASSPHGPWTRQTLDLIDRNPTVRAPDLAAEVGRETAEFKKDVRKLKELGLTESLAIGYLLSPRGEAVVDASLPSPRQRAPRQQGTPLPRTIGAPATRALREAGLTTLEQIAGRSADDLAAMHGVGPIAIDRLREALAERGTGFAGE